MPPRRRREHLAPPAALPNLSAGSTAPAPALPNLSAGSTAAAAPVPAARPAPTIDLTRPWPDPREPGAESVTHLQWAERIARQIAVRPAFGFGWRSQEADDLVAVAWQTLAALVPRFDPARLEPGGDPDQLFRGWAWRYVPGECEREAERLLNGGWYWTTGLKSLKRLGRSGAALPPQLQCPTCTEVMRGAGRDEIDGEEEEERPEPIATAHEPRLVITRNGVVVGEQKTAPG